MTTTPVLRHFIETDLFQRTTAGWLTDEEIWEVQATLAVRPTAGDTIRGSGGFRKIRVAQKGRGKSGSGRIVYYYVGPEETIYFIMAFAKSVKATLSKAEVNQLRKHRKEILG